MIMYLVLYPRAWMIGIINNNIKGANHIKIALPVNFRSLPTSIKDLKIDNNTVIVKLQFPIWDDFKDCLSQVRPDIR